MKKFIGMLAVLAITLGVASAATTADAKRLGINEMAGHLGANYLIEVEYSDFANVAPATNTAETLTLDIAAGQGFTLLYADLVTEFVGLNGTDSLTVEVGDGGDDDLFLVMMQMATESTEVSGKFGTTKAVGKFYEAADELEFKFIPNAENATGGFTAGKVRFWVYIAE